jgi:alanine racemase
LSTISKLTLNKKAKLHVKVETGLNRQGAKGTELLSLIKSAKKGKNVVVEGVSMHFANVEDTLDRSFAEGQLKVFKKSLGEILPRGVIRHTAASAAAMIYPKSRMNMIRLGISLYGLWPSKETKLSMKLKKGSMNLKPVMSLKSMVAQIKEVKAGESVGYGRTWYAPRKSKIAVIPVGYSDGYDRKLSGSGRVIINGAYAPIVGRVAMNMITVDVTDIKGVKQEDEVILLGKDKKLEVSAEELAEKIGTINYEVVSRINPLIKRIAI